MDELDPVGAFYRSKLMKAIGWRPEQITIIEDHGPHRPCRVVTVNAEMEVVFDHWLPTMTNQEIAIVLSAARELQKR